jgi:single-strand DNA-binding protein
LNKVILIGRLTKDVEMRQTPNGVSLARFSIAVTRRFKNSNGEYDADFINCIAWRKTGEFIARYFQKGSMMAVVGSIQTRSWDGNDGKKQYATEVIVDEAYFTGSKSENSTGSNTDLSDSSIDDLNSQYGDDFATIGDEEDLPL